MLSVSPRKSGLKAVWNTVADIAAIVLTSIEAIVQPLCKRPGAKMARVNGRKMPPPRSAMDR